MCHVYRYCGLPRLDAGHIRRAPGVLRDIQQPDSEALGFKPHSLVETYLNLNAQLGWWCAPDIWANGLYRARLAVHNNLIDLTCLDLAAQGNPRYDRVEDLGADQIVAHGLGVRHTHSYRVALVRQPVAFEFRTGVWQAGHDD